MNMHTSIRREDADIGTAPPFALLDHVGPDLTKAEPIEDVLKRLGRARTDYATKFLAACRDSGIDASVNYWGEGEEKIMLGCPVDDQERLRRERLDALSRHLTSTPRRRASVLELLNMGGRFIDNRPFPTVEAAAEAFVAAGGRIYVLRDGSCEEVFPACNRTKAALEAEGWEGYPLRRLHQQYWATLRRSGAREVLAALVRARGKLHEGSGAYVWEERQ